MASLTVPGLPIEPRRVKVYELRNNDWFDRGTGFCTGELIQDEPKIIVKSEEDPDRLLLETRIAREDSYQKQQETLIVWTEQNGIDMALSFQEPEGCAAVWAFVSHILNHLIQTSGLSMYSPSKDITNSTADDGLSDDALDPFPHPISLPSPEMGNLPEIEHTMRMASATQPNRDGLAKFLLTERYISKLTPLLSIAEDLESLPDLHRLCNIMKTIILLNDTTIIEHIVSDDIIEGVVGALEYDPDFPSHKANHREFLAKVSKLKEVVPIESEIKKKIHQTYRLQYLKDVVLARILDDPTFSVLNSLIFFNQVDIVTSLHGDPHFVKELFSIFAPSNSDEPRKKDAVLFIQQCSVIAKQLQAPGRSALYTSFIQNGLFQVITFALKHPDATVRIAGADVLLNMIDHDPAMMRSFIYKQIGEKQPPLTDKLIELFLVEIDPGVRAQIAEAIRILLDPSSANVSLESQGKTNSEISLRIRQNQQSNPETEMFLQSFYEDTAKKLFHPLKELEKRSSMSNFSIHETSLLSHLIDLLCFFTRQHLFRSKYFILAENLGSRIAQLLGSNEKTLQLMALKFFRTCIGLQDEFYYRQIMSYNLFEPIINIVLQTQPKNNLLNSACLEFFEFIRREVIKPLIQHLVSQHREKLKQITYVDTFHHLIMRADQWQFQTDIAESTDFATPTDEERNRYASNQPLTARDLDAAEEEYFNGDDSPSPPPTSSADVAAVTTNGSPRSKPLVSYGSDEEEAGISDAENVAPKPKKEEDEPIVTLEVVKPPERLAEKRRRSELDDGDGDDDEDDALGKLARKRRNSGISTTSSSAEKHNSVTSPPSTAMENGHGTETSSNGGATTSEKTVSSPEGNESVSSPPSSTSTASSTTTPTNPRKKQRHFMLGSNLKKDGAAGKEEGQRGKIAISLGKKT